MKARFWLWALAAALLVAVILAPFASSWPDGLEKVAEALGFAERAEVAPAVSAPLPDYQVPGIIHPGLSTALAGVVGTVLVFVLLYAVARLIASRSPHRHADSTP